MKFIQKGNEPEAWKIYRNTEGVPFSAISELKHALLAEQGYLCCYCMSRINFNTMKVEHWKPRRYSDLVFDYKNLLAACKGNFCDDKHCDTLKDDDEISIDPTSKTHNVETFIKYKWSDGSITYPDAYQHDIEDVLNLNNPVLKSNRKEVIVGLTQVLSSKKFTKTECQKQLRKFQEPDKSGKYHHYCMVAVRFLEKRIRSIS